MANPEIDSGESLTCTQRQRDIPSEPNYFFGKNAHKKCFLRKYQKFRFLFNSPNRHDVPFAHPSYNHPPHEPTPHLHLPYPLHRHISHTHLTPDTSFHIHLTPNWAKVHPTQHIYSSLLALTHTPAPFCMLGPPFLHMPTPRRTHSH